MSKLILDLPLGNRHGIKRASTLYTNDGGRTFDQVLFHISDHNHYAALEVRLQANDEHEEVLVGDLRRIDAEDMDAICAAWLKYRQIPPG